MIRPRIQVSPRTRDQFVNAARGQARRAARRELGQIGEAWVDEVTKIVQAELPRRDGVRHKRNTTHLEESFQYRVVEGPDRGFPMRLELTTKPGVNAKKIAALEYGIKKQYPIEAKRAKSLRWGDVPGDLTKPMKRVTWRSDGPNSHGQIARGYGFMRRARRRVLARRRR